MTLPDTYSVYTQDEVDQIEAGLPMAKFHWDSQKWLQGWVNGPTKDYMHYNAHFLCLKVVWGFYIHLTYCCDNMQITRWLDARTIIEDYEFYSPTINDMINLLTQLIKGLELIATPIKIR